MSDIFNIPTSYSTRHLSKRTISTINKIVLKSQQLTPTAEEREINVSCYSRKVTEGVLRSLRL